MDPVNVVLLLAFALGCIWAIRLTIGLPLERGDPYAEAFGDVPAPVERGDLP
jgi:hypothetical protein